MTGDFAKLRSRSDLTEGSLMPQSSYTYSSATTCTSRTRTYCTKEKSITTIITILDFDYAFFAVPDFVADYGGVVGEEAVKAFVSSVIWERDSNVGCLVQTCQFLLQQWNCSFPLWTLFLRKMRIMGTRRAFYIASTQILKTYYVYIIIIVLNLKHTGVHYTSKNWEKVKKSTIFCARLPQKLFLFWFPRECEKIWKFRVTGAIK